MRKLTLILGWVAALLYSSWPLGFLLDPSVADHDLASELAAPHRPYGWLFTWTDIACGIVLFIVAILQYRRARPTAQKFVIVWYALFGFLVALAAASPLSCDPGSGQCGSIWNKPTIIIHGFASIVSVLFLLASLLFLLPSTWRQRKVYRWLLVTVGVGWPVFGVSAVIEITRSIHTNMLQYYFITVCSLTTGLVVQILSTGHARLEKNASA